VDYKVFKVNRVLQVLRDYKEFRESKVHRDFVESKVQ
jgi:hypothetical protein